jgi:ABC-2 type transport system permease protein
MRRLVQTVAPYWWLAHMLPKQTLVYNVWFWVQLFVQGLAMTIFVFFWRAVYSGQPEVAGIAFQHLLNYVLLTHIFLRCLQSGNQMILTFGRFMMDGSFSIELLRPVDFQAGVFVQTIAGLLTDLVMKIPLMVLAVMVFGLHLPTDPLLWISFAVSLALGTTALFLFDWILASLVFYTTEGWGLSLTRYAIASFFGGAFVPLTFMPDWLGFVAYALPFSQALHMPVAFLSGLESVAHAPQTWLVQLGWIAVLYPLSRLVFQHGLHNAPSHGG